MIPQNIPITVTEKAEEKESTSQNKSLVDKAIDSTESSTADESSPTTGDESAKSTRYVLYHQEASNLN